MKRKPRIDDNDEGVVAWLFGDCVARELEELADHVERVERQGVQ